MRHRARTPGVISSATASPTCRGARGCPASASFDLKGAGEAEAVLYWINPGRVMPSHTHDGSEVTLVLRGGFSDPTGHYRRGDIAIADSDLDHHPRADEDEDCICFAVIDAPLRLTGTVGRIVQRISRALTGRPRMPW